MHFRYGENPVLNGVSLDYQRGRKSRAGGRLRRRQIDAGAGHPRPVPAAVRQRVYSTACPTTEIGLDVVRENVATVLQHPALFNDSVRMNLTLGRDMRRRRTMAGAGSSATGRHGTVPCPSGLDTIVGRQGVRLSGGQRQRLAIARMILADPQSGDSRRSHLRAGR